MSCCFKPNNLHGSYTFYKICCVDEFVVQHTSSFLYKGVTISVLASAHCQPFHFVQISPTLPGFCGFSFWTVPTFRTTSSMSLYLSPHCVDALKEKSFPLTKTDYEVQFRHLIYTRHFVEGFNFHIWILFWNYYLDFTLKIFFSLYLKIVFQP